MNTTTSPTVVAGGTPNTPSENLCCPAAKLSNVYHASQMYTMNMNLKYIALQLCTCTWIEIMTGAGITLYLTYLQSYMLAVLTLAVFAPLIGFHFLMARLSESEDYCTSTTCIRRSRF